jgi:3-hydroxyacyl-[acyl-carrier-protein] dehydratase
MKLKDSFYKVTDFSAHADKSEFSIQFNPSHPVYQAHFPGNPVTPGVCIIQMVGELAMEHLKCKLFLRKVSKVRFLNVIQPVENEEINLTLSVSGEGQMYQVAATVFSGEHVFSRLSLIMESL